MFFFKWQKQIVNETIESSKDNLFVETKNFK
jgi:hypothetical protein